MFQRRFLLAAVAIVFVILCGILMGPKPRVLPFTPRELSLPTDLDQWLETQEAKVPGIREGLQKGIVWANPQKMRTRLSVVYLHGFAASRKEVSPVVEMVAKKLGANAFFTRMTGHGQDGKALGEADVNQWLADAMEAYAVAEKIGEQVIVIGTSTGAALATWLAREKKLSSLVLISPNFGLKDKRSEILLWPWGIYVGYLIVGKEYSWEPKNELQVKYWTNRYPLASLLQMMSLTKFVGTIDLNDIKTPTLMIYTPSDNRIDVRLAVKRFEALGSQRKQLIRLDEAKTHVLAGEATSPETTDKVAKLIAKFLSEN